MEHSPEEILEIITSIANRLAHKYTFGYLDVDDIKQEAIIMGYEALARYDPGRPLENFIYVHINNRLKTFKRDNYFRINAGTAEPIQQAKKNIMSPVSIDSLNPFKEDDMFDEAYLTEMRDHINKNLPSQLRKDYLRICSGAKVSKNIRTKVIEALKIILEKYNERE